MCNEEVLGKLKQLRLDCKGSTELSTGKKGGKIKKSRLKVIVAEEMYQFICELIDDNAFDGDELRKAHAEKLKSKAEGVMSNAE